MGAFFKNLPWWGWVLGAIALIVIIRFIYVSGVTTGVVAATR